MGYVKMVKANIRAAVEQGHVPVSQGVGFFRRTKCELRGYLDESPHSEFFKPCPGKSKSK